MKKRTIYGWFALICGFLTCVYFNAFLGNQQGLLLEPISTALNMPRTLYSSIMSIAAVVSTIASFIYPTAYKKLGLRAMSIIGALGAVLFCFFYYLAGIMTGAATILFVIGQICFGVTCGWATLVMSTTLINNWFAKNRGTLISITSTLTGVTSIFAAPLVTLWIINFGWDKSMLFRGIIGIAVLVFYILTLREKPGEKDAMVWADSANITETTAAEAETAAAPDDGNAVSGILKTKNFWFCLIVSFGIGLVVYPAFVCLAANASDLGYASNVGTLMSVVYATNIIVTLPMGGLIEKFGCRMVLIPMFILIGLGMFILAGSSVSLPVLYFASVLMGVGFSTFNVPIAMMALEVAGEKGVVQVQSYYFSIMNAGMIFGPPLFNIIYDAQGTYHMAYIMGLVCVVVLIAAVFFGTGRKKA